MNGRLRSSGHYCFAFCCLFGSKEFLLREDLHQVMLLLATDRFHLTFCERSERWMIGRFLTDSDENIQDNSICGTFLCGMWGRSGGIDVWADVFSGKSSRYPLEAAWVSRLRRRATSVSLAGN